MMPLVVGVAFRPVTKVYYFSAKGFEDLEPAEYVIVETSRGRTLGQVVFTPRQVASSEVSGTLKPVVRRATAWDMVQADQMSHKEAETLGVCRKRAVELGLDMKITRAEWSFDGSSVVIYFTAEQRIDFRSLVHELAQALRARVEMRQIGVRDQAKLIGGIGKCGRQLCCATWLRDFAPVSIKMAKTQDLPLNASEVSGVCGRLLCCLAYENDFYAEARKQMPKVNSMLATPQGVGKVKQVHVLENSVTVLVEGPSEERLLLDVPVPEPDFSALHPRVGAKIVVSEGEADSTYDREGQPEPVPGQEMGAPPSQPASSATTRPSRRRPRSRQRQRQSPS